MTRELCSDVPATSCLSKGKYPFCLIVHQNDNTGNNMVALPFLLSKILLHQETDGLRTVCERIGVQTFVQCVQEFFIKRYTKTFQRHNLLIYIQEQRHGTFLRLLPYILQDQIPILQYYDYSLVRKPWFSNQALILSSASGTLRAATEGP